MPDCLYKRTFLKDLARIPKPYQQKIEDLIFHLIPESQDIFSEFDIQKMRGMPGFFRIRSGQYRIGIELTENDRLLFHRIKSREEIYSVFP